MGDKQEVAPPSDDGKVGDCIKEGFTDVRIPCRAVRDQHLEMTECPPPYESREGNGSISRPEVRAVREEKPERSEKTCPRVPWWGSLLSVIGLAILGVLLGVLVISIRGKYGPFEVNSNLRMDSFCLKMMGFDSEILHKSDHRAFHKTL